MVRIVVLVVCVSVPTGALAAIQSGFVEHKHNGTGFEEQCTLQTGMNLQSGTTGKIDVTVVTDHVKWSVMGFFVNNVGGLPTISPCFPSLRDAVNHKKWKLSFNGITSPAAQQLLRVELIDSTTGATETYDYYPTGISARFKTKEQAGPTVKAGKRIILNEIKPVDVKLTGTAIELTLTAAEESIRHYGFLIACGPDGKIDTSVTPVELKPIEAAATLSASTVTGKTSKLEFKGLKVDQHYLLVVRTAFKAVDEGGMIKLEFLEDGQESIHVIKAVS